MGGLVYPQRAALLAQAVPAPEVVGAVAGVEVPREVHRGDRADLAREQDLLDLAVLGRVAVVEGDPDLASRALLGVQQGAHLLLVYRHGLLGQHVDATLQGFHDAGHVGGVHRGHHQQVGPCLVQHLVEVREGWALYAQGLLRHLDAEGIHVAQAHELQQVRVAGHQGLAPHAYASHARAHYGVATLGLGLALGDARRHGQGGRAACLGYEVSSRVP